MAESKLSSDAQKFDPSFAREILALENGHYVFKCMNCGVCVVSCAAMEEMEYAPRRLFNQIKLGKKDTVVNTNTMWMCTSCCTCKARCPRGIPIIDVMHDLKKYCIDHGYTKFPQAEFYQAFWADLKSRGRTFEGSIMARYLLKKGFAFAIKQALEMKDLGMEMIKRGRMPLFPPGKIKGYSSLSKIIAKAQSQHKEAK